MKLFHKNSSKVRFVALLTLITLVFGALLFILIASFHSTTLDMDEHRIREYEDEYNITISNYRLIANTYYNTITDNEEIMGILNRANSVGKYEQAFLRASLIELLNDTYSDMVDMQFRQLHFVLEDGTSFLRMHSPEKFGDNLLDVRDTVRIVNETHEYVEGFEEGRILNGYRYEYPLFYEDEYIGCVEASISFVAIAKSMHELFDTPTIFLIKKSVVDEKVFEDEVTKNYLPSQLADSYYYDREGYEYLLGQGDKFDSIYNLIDDDASIKQVGEMAATEQSFIINQESDGQLFSNVFLKVENLKDEQVGYLVFFEPNKTASSLNTAITTQTVLLIALWLLVMIVIITLNRLNSRIKSLTYHDKLTGAYNRNRLYEIIQQKIDWHERYGSTFSLSMFDIDYFKAINDDYGHMTGDLILKDIVTTTGYNLRKTDYLFRFGGDEFILIFPQTDLEAAKTATEKIRNVIAEKTSFPGIDRQITISVGVVQYWDGESIPQLMERVDGLLYKAKEQGRNRVVSE